MSDDTTRRFYFPQNTMWILEDGQEAVFADLEGGGTGILVFSDEDLALTYAEENSLPGKKPKSYAGIASILTMLNQFRRLGVTHVVIDHVPGRQSPVKFIEEAIDHVSRTT